MRFGRHVARWVASRRARLPSLLQKKLLQELDILSSIEEWNTMAEEDMSRRVVVYGGVYGAPALMRCRPVPHQCLFLLATDCFHRKCAAFQRNVYGD
jgi:hypothetical protein